jgi:hypothetical protein
MSSPIFMNIVETPEFRNALLRLSNFNTDDFDDSKLIRNAIRTPDGTVMESIHRHDYVTHKDANGEIYMVDGGRNYIRRSHNNEVATDLTVVLEDDYETVRSVYQWGTRGRFGDEPLSFVLLKDIDDDHLYALIKLYERFDADNLRLFMMEAVYRSPLYQTGYNYVLVDSEYPEEVVMLFPCQ